LKELARSQDPFGTVLVTDDGNRRYLSFGEEDEQSCILKSQPSHPQYAFVRVMLLVLIYIEPKRALSFGLGAGSLNTALAGACPSLKQQIVEIRQRVADYAHRYFYLPKSDSIDLIVADAADFVEEPIAQRFDLIFSDLYTAQGLCDIQIDDRFLQGCIERLRPKGWLVLNCWREHRADQVLDLLSKQFDYLFSATTQDGNWILFATNHMPDISQADYKRRAKELSERLGYSLLALSKRLKPVER